MKELSDESLEAEKIYFEKKAAARRALLEDQMNKVMAHPEFDEEELWDDVWFGDQDELTLVRNNRNGIFNIAIARDGNTEIDEMVSIAITSNDIPMLISALQHLLAKDK
jgi:hypothetical protein